MTEFRLQPPTTRLAEERDTTAVPLSLPFLQHTLSSSICVPEPGISYSHAGPEDSSQRNSSASHASSPVLRPTGQIWRPCVSCQRLIPKLKTEANNMAVSSSNRRFIFMFFYFFLFLQTSPNHLENRMPNADMIQGHRTLQGPPARSQRVRKFLKQMLEFPKNDIKYIIEEGEYILFMSIHSNISLRSSSPSTNSSNYPYHSSNFNSQLRRPQLAH